VARTARLIAAVIVGLATAVAGAPLASAQPSAEEQKASAPAERVPPEAAPDATPAPEMGAKTDGVCRAIERSAADNGLPVEFFTRLIWQESRFDPSAQSRAGAQGIAQFMPRTASWRGLANPFEPLEALRESAGYLHELRTTFGNLGLAAAAYNAGPGRVSAWLAGRRGLPGETRAYVRIVTGHSAEEWAGPEPPKWEGAEIPKGVPCAQLVNLVTAPPSASGAPNTSGAPWAPWGVQLAGNWSQGKVLASWEQLRRRYTAVLGEREPLILRSRTSGMGYALRYQVRIGENTRQGAERLCTKLLVAGGACVVLRNPPGTS
jgi:hypothetical protein